MRKIFCTITLVTGILVPVLSFAQGGSKTITCESEKDRQAYCRTYTTGRVELRRQLSKASCREYDTWGATGDGSGVWVRDGCRAEFVVEERRWGHGGGRGQGGSKTITCESERDRQAYCRTYATGRVELREQLSKAPCREYDTWGATGDGSGVWVRNGCRAEFAVRQQQWGGGGGRDRDDERTFTCKSKQYDYNHCSVPGGRARRVELVRQISKARCERGNTWGEDSRGVWVMDGCEGEFSARY